MPDIIEITREEYERLKEDSLYLDYIQDNAMLDYSENWDQLKSGFNRQQKETINAES